MNTPTSEHTFPNGAPVYLFRATPKLTATRFPEDKDSVETVTSAQETLDAFEAKLPNATIIESLHNAEKLIEGFHKLLKGAAIAEIMHKDLGLASTSQDARESLAISISNVASVMDLVALRVHQLSFEEIEEGATEVDDAELRRYVENSLGTASTEELFDGLESAAQTSAEVGEK